MTATSPSQTPPHSHSSGVNPRAIRSGIIIAVLAAFLFSTKPILIKYLYQLGMDPLPLMWMRMLLAMPVYIAIGVIVWNKRSKIPQFRDIAAACGIGLLGYYLASLLDLIGLQYISAQFERVILYAYPSFVVILGGLFFSQTIRLHIIVPLLLTYSGLIVMYSQEGFNAENSANVQLGTALILASAVSFALYILFSKKVIQTLGSLLFTSLAMGSASVATGIHYAFATPKTNTNLLHLNVEIWTALVALAIFATVIPSFLTSEAIKRIGPAKTSMTGTLGPVMTTLMAAILLSEPITIFTIGGMALVIAGVSLLSK